MAAERLAGREGILTTDVRIIPAKRTATYSVPLESDRERPRTMTAKVQASDVALSSRWPGTSTSRDGIVWLPKTLEAVRNAVVLLEAVEAELLAQDITE